jgi:DNA polymerase (family 10)
MRIKPNRISWKEADNLYQLESKDIVTVLEQNGVQVKNISPAGSLRRGRKTIGDLDIVIEVDNPQLAGKTLEDEMDYQFFAKGSFYKSQILDIGIDLFIAGHHNYYSMLFFLTGCEDWNLRIMKHLRISSDTRYTPFRFINKCTKEVYNFKSEEDIFKLIKHIYTLPKDRIPQNMKFGE